jgi:uncharacterized membrane protein
MGGSDNAEVYVPPKIPPINPVTLGDVRESLLAGFADFMRAPLFGLFFGGIFAVGGLAILASLTVFNMPWMIIPVAIGFPLLGPFVAVGLYEVSRRLANGQPLVWGEILLVVFRQRERQLSWMAFVVLFIFWMWIYQVRLLLALFLGFKSFSSIPRFIEVVTTTSEGFAFLAVGTLVGAVLALVLFSATVIAMPLLLDRELDFISAMIVSFRTVILSPLAMITWGVLVAVFAIAAMVPAFLGMLVVLPVLGHATWHLYERAIGSE